MQNLKNCKYWRTLSDIVLSLFPDLLQAITALAMRKRISGAVLLCGGGSSARNRDSRVFYYYIYII
jgi:hypothetical protein